VVKRRHGADALLDVIEQLQGASLPASILETEILPARLDQYDPADLDAVIAAGEIVWVGVESLGERDGRVALYLADHLARLLPPVGDGRRVRRQRDRGVHKTDTPTASLGDRETAIVEYLRDHGASFFGPVHDAAGGGYPAETVNALWNLAWHGVITNDTFHALRAFTHSRAPRRRARRAGAPSFRSRRLLPPAAEGRWSVVPVGRSATHDATQWAAATAQQLLARHGVLTREAVAAESIPGGFGVVYPVLKAMEEAGRLRRGYFVAGLGATQFALPGALDLLRSFRSGPSDPGDSDGEVAALAATDPANPFGATLKWPAFAAGAAAGQARSAPGAAPARQARFVDDAASAREASPADSPRGPTRTVGATVILVDGALAAYLARGDRMLLTWVPEDEPQRSRTARAIARVLIERARSGADSPRGMLVEEIDGRPTAHHPIAPFLVEAGFIPGALGYQANLRNA
jgi:ATP-dependent Lhr-like helicase